MFKTSFREIQKQTWINVYHLACWWPELDWWTDLNSDIQAIEFNVLDLLTFPWFHDAHSISYDWPCTYPLTFVFRPYVKTYAALNVDALTFC